MQLLPPSVRKDPDIVAAAKLNDEAFYLIVNEVNNCIVVPNIYNITDHKLLDLLAWDRHVDFYDTSLPIRQKQEIIDNSFRQHMKKGTPAAVEKLINTIFGDGEIQEWFNYGGDPYYFQVMTNNETATNEKAEEFLRAVNSTKNLRSHLEKVVITKLEDFKMYYAGVLHMGEYLTIRQVV